ncbi:TfoX/Sxy family DNA transformation protein [Vibrio sp. 10N.239.312.D08]|uniref:TfoX/Sxy family DNA transformation protein n=1 Tax=Vibrio sp. 10N.239.312.D08 TaxID=3229978 RepID=UPI003552D413
MTLNIEKTLLEFKADNDNVRLQTMFGHLGIFIDDVFIGYLHRENHFLFLRTCRLTEDLKEKQPLLETLSINHGKFKREQKAYRIPNEYIKTHSDLKEVIKNACLDRKKQGERQNDTGSRRIKSLPNMTIAIEKQLRSAGIVSASDLINQGSKDAFVKLAHNQQLRSQLILKLEGAVAGCHEAVIPKVRREDLLAFANNEIERRQFAIAS